MFYLILLLILTVFSVFLCFVFGAFTYCLCCLRRAKFTALILFEGTQDCLKLCNLQSMCSDDPTHPDLQLMPPFHLVSCEFSPKDPNLLAGQHPLLLAGGDFAATQKFYTVLFYIICNFRAAGNMVYNYTNKQCTLSNRGGTYIDKLN